MISAASGALLAIGLLSGASAAVIVSDNFEGATGVPEGRRPAVDNTGILDNRWTWATGHTYLEDRFIISAVTGSSIGGRVRIPAPRVPTEVSCVAQMDTGVEGSSPYMPVEWVALGFLASPTADWLNPDGGNLLWALVRPDGGWTIFENGTFRVLAISTDDTRMPAFERGFFNTSITLRYDKTASLVALLVDGKNISGWQRTGVDATKIGAAGFHALANPTSDPRTVKISLFSVKTPSSAPAKK